MSTSIARKPRISPENQGAILIVDDIPANMGVIVGYLEERGLTIVVASDGEEGIERARFVRPDLILLDVMMPGIDGFETCRRLKTDEATRNIPVIFMTALADTAHKLSGFETGAVDYVTKPFQAEEVLARVNVHLTLRRTQRQLSGSEQRFRDFAETASDWFWESDHALCLTYVSDRFSHVTGFEADPIGVPAWDVYRLESPHAADNPQEACAAQRPFRNCECIVCIPGKDPRYVSISGKPVFDGDGHFLGYRGIGRDVTERRHDLERINYLAYHDALTSLPNRTMFSKTLNHAINSARRYQRRLAVLFIDLDRFKNINDTLGHEAGDKLLQEMGRRLRQILRKSDTLARLGGDEFVLLLEEIEETKNVSSVVSKLTAAIFQPFQFLGQEFRITASIGISIFPDDASDEHTLMRNADIAMYRAKEQGKNNCQFYSAEINTHSFKRLMLESNLRLALEHQEFVLHYQPKIGVHANRVTGTEALLRWNHPELGMIAPNQFIPLAEETGLIVPIGRWVLRTACEQNRIWLDNGLPRMRIAVNLSRRQFTDNDLLADITGILQDTGMDPDLLELEITESMVLNDVDRALKLLQEIRRMGIHVAIDDFGTGYSSLSNLSNFPVDVIKIDRSFINEIPRGVEDMAIVKAIIAIGKTLSMTVVAEGCETGQQLEFLRDQNCDETQGYYFSKPISAEEMTTFLNRQQPNETVSGRLPKK